MASLIQYSYSNNQIEIYAPLKHGTRWLRVAGVDVIENSIQLNVNGWEKILQEKLFTEGKLINPNTYFVYRDTYEWFTSAIKTSAADAVYAFKYKGGDRDGMKGVWDGDVSNTKALITDNHHYNTNYWRKIKKLFEEVACTDIKLISLNDLSLFMKNNNLGTDYVKEIYHFNSNMEMIDGSIVDIIELTKNNDKELWDKYIIDTELEQDALNSLVDKFKWKPNYKFI